MRKYLRLTEKNIIQAFYDFVDLDLILEYDTKSNVITFSGKRTPDHLVSQDTLWRFNINGVDINVTSSSYPEIFIEDYGSSLLIGGEEHNNDYFKISKKITGTYNRIKVLKLFKSKQLNKLIKVL